MDVGNNEAQLLTKNKTSKSKLNFQISSNFFLFLTHLKSLQIIVMSYSTLNYLLI